MIHAADIERAKAIGPKALVVLVREELEEICDKARAEWTNTGSWRAQTDLEKFGAMAYALREAEKILSEHV